MRLICPNCDAQYEVPDDVIPTEGRDVQCSNCGQTWFQHHPDNPPAPSPQAEPEPTEERAQPAAEPEQARKSREIDPSIADILRQEAEQERQAREAETLESQPELGLDDIAEQPAPEPEPEAEVPQPEPEDETVRRSREARARMARLRGEEPEPAPEPQIAAAATAAAAGSRRDLLPDIEEINSTLRSTGDRKGAAAQSGAPEAEPVVKARQRSFRRGFATSVVIVALLVALYVATPRIIGAVPAAQPVLTAYTGQVDALRLWLDGRITTLLQWMDSASGA